MRTFTGFKPQDAAVSVQSLIRFQINLRLTLQPINDPSVQEDFSQNHQKPRFCKSQVDKNQHVISSYQCKAVGIKCRTG